jgi:hypothetical protein
MKTSFASAGKPGSKTKNSLSPANGITPANGGDSSHSDVSAKSLATTDGDLREGSSPTHEQIANLACQLYIESGRQEGRDAENWLRAERILRQQANRQGSQSRSETVRKSAAETAPRSRQQF